jgi:hypothetical protein
MNSSTERVRHIESIAIDRDPILAAREGHDAIEYALMHPSQFSKKNLQRLEIARGYLALALRDM